MDNLSVPVRISNIPLLIMTRTMRQEINKCMGDLNGTRNQLGLPIIDRTFYPTKAQYILFFSSTHGSLTKIDHMLDRP